MELISDLGLSLSVFSQGFTVAQIATTIARPDRGYGGTYNYFDPDNFISLSAMIYSNDKYLQDQAISGKMQCSIAQSGLNGS
jgi:hypothetical protein